MVPVTFFAGMTLPLITRLLMARGAGERAIGAVYALNTVGAIVGVMLAIHVLMPAVGVKGTIVIGATLHLLLAIAGLQAAGRGRAQLPTRAPGGRVLSYDRSGGDCDSTRPQPHDIRRV